MSVIEAINVSPAHGQPQAPVNAAQLTVAAGLIGDRHSNRRAVVSLIAAEEVEAFNEATGLDIAAAQTGRNIVTRGVDLNALVAKRFRVAGVELEGFELCEPCATLGGLLGTEEVSAAEVVRRFTHRAGLRATVRGDGWIRVGDAVIV